MRPGAGDDADHQRRMHETLALYLYARITGTGILLYEFRRNDRAGPFARRTLNDYEPPGRKLAMVRHAGGDAQNIPDFAFIRPRAMHGKYGYRSPRFQQFEHGVQIRPRIHDRSFTVNSSRSRGRCSVCRTARMP